VKAGRTLSDQSYLPPLHRGEQERGTSYQAREFIFPRSLTDISGISSSSVVIIIIPDRTWASCRIRRRRG
jgi:hypothetical protein